MLAPRQLIKLALLQGCCAVAVQVPFPATVEVDLIFPRNDTYAPSAMTPIVFAIQNSQLAPPLNLNLQYFIYYLGDSHISNGSDGEFDFRYVSFSSNPYFVYHTDSVLNATEGRCKFVWSLFAGNCSGSVEDGATLGDDARGGGFLFTTMNGAQQPDLVAATADCANNTESLTFGITGTLPFWDTSILHPQNSCAVISPTPPPANPCGAKVDASAASSISAAITAAECSDIRPLHPAISCPTVKSVARGLHGGLGWLSLTSCWLACLLVL